MILAGRRLNDNMGLYVAVEVVKLMTAQRIHIKGARVLVLGLTFKENCPDIRNSKVVDLIRELEKYGALVQVYDPWVNAEEVRHKYGITAVKKPRRGYYDAVIVAVAHDQFKAMGAEGCAQPVQAESRGIRYQIRVPGQGRRWPPLMICGLRPSWLILR